MRNIKGLKVKGKKLIHWEELLNNWILYIQRYCDMMDGGDAPYFHTERANVGVLASAAWKTGWLALEAFNSKKRGKKRGRCDLYLLSKDEKEEYIESKQKWSVDSPERIYNYLEETMKFAKELPRNLTRIGVLFIIPNFNEKFQSQIDKKIDEAINTALEVDCDAIAWSFPISTRQVIWGDSRIYPGVFLIAKCVD